MAQCPSRLVASAEKEVLIASATPEQKEKEVIFSIAEYDSEHEKGDSEDGQQHCLVLRAPPPCTKGLPRRRLEKK